MTRGYPRRPEMTRDDPRLLESAPAPLWRRRGRPARLARTPPHTCSVTGHLAAWRHEADSLVFLHIAKCGGTSFNGRLTSLRRGDGDGCACARDASRPMHNGRGLAASVASLGTAGLCEVAPPSPQATPSSSPSRASARGRRCWLRRATAAARSAGATGAPRVARWRSRRCGRRLRAGRAGGRRARSRRRSGGGES